MKVSISIANEDLEYLDDFAERTGLASRSAAVQKAVRALRASELGAQYAAAWEEFEAGGDAALWETTVGDGLDEP